MRSCIAVCLLGLMVLPAYSVTINEIRIDQTGTDNDEYFELAGASGESLNDLTYLVIGDGTGASGVVEAVVSLAGQSVPADGYFLAAETTLTLPASVDLSLGATGLNFENSDNVTHLLVSGWTGTLNADLDTNDDGVLDATPWVAVADQVALIKELNPPATTEWYYGTTTVGPEGTFVPGHVYRLPNGDGPWNIGPFDAAVGLDTPGVANVPEPASLALLGLGALALVRRRR